MVSPRTASVPPSPLTWVIGARGLLGSALQEELAGSAFVLGGAFTWQRPEALHAEQRGALSAFAARVAESPGRPWAIAWCAGLAVVGMEPERLAAETATLRSFLQLLSLEARLEPALGTVLLASSAGGVYGGSAASPIGESTPPAPSSPYGREKLLQEQLVSTWAAARGVRCLVARVSNVYGPSQRLEKQQGLISHMARCSIYDVPVQLYVSLETVRDYLYAEDWARRAAVGLRRLALSPPTAHSVVKIFASEHELSIAALLGVFRRVVPRPLRVVFTPHAAAAQQPAHLQFRSEVWLPEPLAPLALEEGVRRVYEGQLERFEAGLLPRPPQAGL